MKTPKKNLLPLLPVLATAILVLGLMGHTALAQNDRMIRVSFEKDSTIIHEDSATLVRESIRILIKVEGELTDQDSMVFSVKDTQKGDASPLDYRLSPKEQMFTVTRSSSKLLSVNLEVLSDDKKEDKETIFISLEGKSCKGNGLRCEVQGQHTVVIGDPEEAKPYEAPTEFRILTGANFDFNDGLSATHVYGALHIFLPQCFNNKIGMFGGLYNTQSVSVDSSNVTRDYSFFLNFNPLTTKPGDSLLAVSEYFTRKATTTIKNLGIYGAITHRISGPGKSKSRGNTVLYGGIYLEVIKRNYFTTYSYETARANDTDQLVYPSGKASNMYSRPASFSSSIYENFFGLCSRFHFDSKDVELRVNPVIGGNFLSGNNRLGIFYMMNFSVMEKYTGISLGGEWRSVARFGVTRVYTTIYLSKAFPLNKLKTYLTL